MADETSTRQDDMGEPASEKTLNGSNGSHAGPAAGEARKPSAEAASPDTPPPAEPAPAEAQEDAPAAPARGFGSIAAGAIAGALAGIVVFAGAGLVTGGKDALATRVATLETRLTANAAATGDPEAIARLEAKIAETDAAGLAERLTKFDRRLGTLEGRVAGLAESGTGAGLPPQELSRLETRFNGYTGEVDQRAQRIEGRLDRLEAMTPEDLRARLDAAASGETLDALAGRVASLERNEVTQDTRRAVIAVALASLVRASSGSEPFAGELDALAILAPHADGVTELAPFAEKGVPTAPMLAVSFKPAARKALHADAAASANEGWLVKLWANFRTAILVRTDRDVEADSATGILARAEQRLAEGNLAAAVDEVKALQGPAGEAMAPWLAEAQSRARLDGLVSGVSARLLADLGRDL